MCVRFYCLCHMQLPHLAVCVCELNTVCTNNHVYVHIRCIYVQYGEMEFSVKEPENVGKNEIETAIENKFVLEGKFSLDNRCKKSYSARNLSTHIYSVWQCVQQIWTLFIRRRICFVAIILNWLCHFKRATGKTANDHTRFVCVCVWAVLITVMMLSEWLFAAQRGYDDPFGYLSSFWNVDCSFGSVSLSLHCLASHSTSIHSLSIYLSPPTHMTYFSPTLFMYTLYTYVE